MDAKKLNLTPKMAEALVAMRLENVKPERLNPAVRAGLVKRHLLERTSYTYRDGDTIVEYRFTYQGEDLADQLLQERDLGPLTDEVLDAAYVEDLHRSGTEDISDHVGTGDLEIGTWVRITSDYSTVAFMRGKAWKIDEKYDESYGFLLAPGHHQHVPFDGVQVIEDLSECESCDEKFPPHLMIFSEDVWICPDCYGRFMYEEGVRFGRAGAGSDETHPEFLRGWNEGQDQLEAGCEVVPLTMSQDEADFEEARGDFGEPEPVTLLTRDQVLSKALEIKDRPARRDRMELQVVAQAKGDERQYLVIIGKLSRYLPRIFIEMLVERLVIDRCPVCSVRPGKAAWARLDWTPNRFMRWVSYCSERCFDAALLGK